MQKGKPDFQLFKYFPVIGGLLALLIGVVWIGFSDAFLASLFDDAESITYYQSVKGYLFICFFSFVVWLLLKQQYRFLYELNESEAALQKTVQLSTERQAQLKESENRFQQLVDSMTTISVQGYDEYGTVMFWNTGSEHVYGYTRAEAMGKNLVDLIIPEHMRPVVTEAIAEMVKTGVAHQAEELQLLRKDGSYVDVFSSHAVIKLPNRTSQVYCIDIDLTALKMQEAQVAFLAQYDPLTGLANRQFFASQVEQAIRLARRKNTLVAILALDLDHFKTINDSYGHTLGDRMLKHVAERLRQCCRDTDTVSRLSGDEFAIMREHLEQAEDVAHFAQAIMQQLQQSVVLDGITLSTAVSIGISLFPQHHTTAETLLQGADAALYKAKAEGRNTYYYYSDQLTEQARQRLVTEARLRQAVKSGELSCFYQPQLDITSNRIVGAELLLRWQDTELGFVSPAVFIPIAESTGLIHIIGHQVLMHACRQGKAWLDAGLPPVRLAVNVSAHQFHKGNLLQELRTVLEETGYPAEYLELEVTESALMHDEDEVVAVMQQLRETGVRLAIDDFGTGYSCLAYLQRLPLDVLKVDMRFVKDMVANPDDRQISKAIIELAHTLRFEVLAEGVETQEQRDLLLSMACDYYQGYLFSRPVPADVFEQLLQTQSQG